MVSPYIVIPWLLAWIKPSLPAKEVLSSSEGDRYTHGDQSGNEKDDKHPESYMGVLGWWGLQWHGDR